jgi:thiosulfate/3-mercaptopyruvate sulfurtransferase
MYTTLIGPGELAARLGDPDWAILDCRFDLARPAWGADSWRAGHIPGALHADLERDLSASVTPATGRHPLPSAATLTATLGRFGIDARVQVVAYDQGPGAYAARLWWLARWLGHRAVAVLDGGYAAWVRAGLPVSSAADARAPRQFVPQPAAARSVTTAEIAAWLASGALARGEPLLVDARSAERFAGENETIDPVAGHIPGARNHPFARNHDPDGGWLQPEELRRAWRATLAGRDAGTLIAMCGSGVTACHNLLALEVAGLPGALLYPGSWSEWIRDPARAVAHGPESAR